MKKIIITTLCLFISFSVKAQFLDMYPSRERFFYNLTSPNATISSTILGVFEEEFNPIYSILTNTFEDTTLTIYGVAIPLTFDKLHILENPNYFGYNTAGWNTFMDSIISRQSKVYVGECLGNSSDIRIRASERILPYQTTITANYFNMPDEFELFPLFPGVGEIPPFLVIETYFQNPIRVSGNIVVGCNAVPFTRFLMWPGDAGPSAPYAGIMTIEDLNRLDFLKWYTVINDSTASISAGGEYAVINYRWGGPFAIIAPPPCSIPMYLEANNVGKRKVRLQWNAQYANTHFQLEYGPQDFTSGTGTTIAPIFPDQNGLCSLTVDSLDMGTDYTFRVRAWCDQATDYSQWVETNLTTEQWYTIFADVNNDDWGRINGNGDYRAGSQVTLTAWPKGSHFRFQIWSDGVTANPRNFTANSDLNLTAVFSCDTCNEDITLPDTQSVSIFPNPSDGKITLLANTAIMHVDILDIQGRILLSLDSNSLTIPLDLAFMNKGIYIVSAQTHKGSFHKKIILK